MPGFRVNQPLLSKQARAVLKTVAREANISITRGVVDAVDDLMRLKNSEIAALSGRLDYDHQTWQDHVRQVCLNIARHLKEDGKFSIHTPRDLVRYAKSLILAQSY